MPNNNINFKINYQKGDTSALDNLKKELNELKSLASNIDMGFSPDEINQLLPTVSTLERALDSAFDVRLNTINVQKFNQILAQSGMNAKSLQQSLSVAGAAGDKVFLQMTSQLMKFNTATKQTNKFLNDIANSFFNTVKYSIFNTILNNIMSTVQRASGYVKSLDSSLNDIRIVTGKSADEMSRFAEQANEAAKQLAVTTSDYTEGSLIYYQQGLDDKTVKTLTDITAMTSNVTGQSMLEVSEQLTAVWNGYQVANQAAEEGMKVYQNYVDKMAAVGAATASDLEELSVAMSKVASAASSMGVDFDDLNAQIATIVSVTRQAPESVGTALKTIYARLGDLKIDGVDEFGTKLGEVSTQLQVMGINILDTNGDMRDMSSVMTEVAEKWNTWTSAQKQAAAVAMAGKRQYNNLVALFDNWDMYGEALETSMEAAGTLEKQQEIALDSLANKMDILRATSEDLYDSLINENDLKKLIDGLTQIVQLTADFADATGGLSTLLPALISSLTKLFSQQISQGLGSIITNIRTDIDKAKVDIQNQAALQAMFKDSSLFQSTTNRAGEQARVEGLTRLKNLYGELSQYQSIMTQEEQQQYNYIVDLANEAGQLNVKIAEQKDTWVQIKNNLGLIDKELINDLSDTTKLTNEVNKIKLAAAELKDKDLNWIDFIHFIKQIGLSKEQVSILEKRFTTLSNTGLKNNEIIEKIVQHLRELGISTEELIKLDTRARSASEGVKALGSSLESNLNLKATIVSITNTISALGQLASAINTITNISNIWSNEDLDISQKWLQTLMNISFVLPMISSAMKTLNAETGISNILKAASNDLSKLGLVFFGQQEVQQTQAIIQQGIENKLLEKYAALKGISVTEISASMKARIAENAAMKAGAIAASEAATAQWSLNAAIAANPIGALIIAVTALISVYVLLEKHQEKIRENAQKQAEESRKAANEFNQEAESNKKLIESYNEILKRYEEGSASKQELYETTDKLIEAYDLEGARLDVLLGKYKNVTEAINAKRDAELESQKRINQTAIEDTTESMFLNTEADKKARGYINRTTNYNTNERKVSYTIGTRQDQDDYTRKQYEAIQAKQKELFGDNLQIDEAGNAEFVVDEDDIGATLDFYNKSLEYRRWLRDEGLKNYEVEKRTSDIIQSLNKDGAIDNLEELRKTQKGIIEEQANLADITSDKDFQSAIDNMRGELSNLYSEDEIDNIIKSAVSHINTSTARQFYIDEAVKEKIGDQFNDTLKTAFHRYDPTRQEAIISLGWDFNLDTLEDFAKMADIQVGSSYKVPVSFQSQINETVLKDKDINKSDWETYTENLPIEALKLLGEREEFNNKTIGQRINLLEKVNELILQENNLASQSGIEYEKSKEKILEQLDIQEQKLKEQAELQQKIIDDANASEEEWDNAEIELERIQEKLIELDKEKYNIEIGLDVSDNITNQVNSMLSTVMTDADKLRAAAESIGEGWKVAAENVGTFAATFPELMDKATIQIDGSLQLDAEYTNQYLENIQKRIAGNKKEAIAAAETQLQKVQLELDYTDKQLELIDQALEGQKTKTEIEEGLEKNALDYSLAMDEAGLLGEKTALEQAQQNMVDATQGIKGSFENINEYIKATNENFAQMFSENPNWSGLAEVKEGIKTLGYKELSEARKQALNAKDIGEEDYNNLLNMKDYYTKQKEILEAQQTDLINSISLTSASIDSANKAADRVKKGLAGKEDKSKSKSGGKDKKDKELLKLDEEFDRYHDINHAIEELDRSLKKLEKDQKNLYGKELIRSLKQENELLENQAQLYNQLLEAQKEEAAELRGVLANSGVAFDASGAVINYAEATAAALERYNQAIKDYNAGLLDDTALEIHKQEYERFKKDLERYEKLYYEEIKQTEEKLDDIHRKELENNLKAWEVEIQLKLDWQELYRGWNDFIKEVTEDFQKVFKDLRLEAKNMLADASTYVGEEGTVNTVINAIHDVMGEIDKIEGGGESDMFESISQAQEKLKELNDQLLDSGKALHQLWVDAWDNYLDGIQQVDDALGNIIERYEQIDEELEFQGKLIELLYGEEAYNLLTKLYEGQEQNLMGQVKSVKQQVDMWKELFEATGASMDNQLDWEEDQKEYYEKWMAAQSQLNDLTIEYIELLKKDYLNTVENILKQFETAITNGSTLAKMNEEWERISANADKYYDSVEGAYYVQTLANKINQGIAGAGDLKAQQKLMALREREIGMLREKENLTEYDLKAAEMRYEIALKEIALQESQNNKTGMKLTRNEQGNWSYQYVADEEDVATKQQELLDAYNNLYQLASDAYEANLEALMELQEKYIESAREIAENDTLTEEERQEQLAELREWYLEEYKNLSEENQLYRDDLAASGAALLLEIYEQDQDAYESMTDAEKELVDTLVKANIEDYQELDRAVKGDYKDMSDAARITYKEIETKSKQVMEDTRRDWTSGAQTLATKWNSDNGQSVKNQVINAYEKIEDANTSYQEAVDELAEAVDRNFNEDGIIQAINDAEDATRDLEDATKEMVEESIPYLIELREYVDEIRDAWRSVEQAIYDAIAALDEYLRKIGEVNEAEREQAEIKASAPAAPKVSSSSGSGSRGGSGSGGNKTSVSSDRISPTANGYWYDTSKGSERQGGGNESNTKITEAVQITGTDQYSVKVSNGLTSKTVQMDYDELVDRGYFKKFATGGYTGSWDNSGKLAILHQKELVLNADDTKNFLDGIMTIRDLVNSNGSIQEAVLKAAAHTIQSLGNVSSNSSILNNNTNNDNNTTENIFNITAEFPNANNVDEIREAILTLPNMASQFINTNLR